MHNASAKPCYFAYYINIRLRSVAVKIRPARGMRLTLEQNIRLTNVPMISCATNLHRVASTPVAGCNQITQYIGNTGIRYKLGCIPAS